MDDTFSDLIDLSSIDKQVNREILNFSFNNGFSSNESFCDLAKSTANSQKLSQNDVQKEGATSNRTKERINEFEAQLECFIKTKQLLLEQFAEETNNIIEKYERKVHGLRQKHSVCENNFKIELDNAHSKYNDLEKKFTDEQIIYRQKVSSYEDELSKSRQQAQLEKETLENKVTEKEKIINEIKNEKLKLESQIKLQKSEFSNRLSQYEDEIRQYKANREKDATEIKKLKEDINNFNKEISSLQNELFILKDKLRKSEDSNLKLTDEYVKIKKQCEDEAKAKLEKIERIQSLTITLNESKEEIMFLQKNFADLETKRSIEVKELEMQLALNQANMEKRISELNSTQSQTEQKHKDEISKLQECIQLNKMESDSLRSQIEQKTNEIETLKQQQEAQLEKFNSEQESLERYYNNSITSLNNKIIDLEKIISDTNSKYESSQSELIKTKDLVFQLENDVKLKNSELNNIQERYNLLELDQSTTSAELDNFKRMLQIETAEKKEKLRIIQNLTESVSSSQIEIEKLKEVNEQLQRSLKDGDDLRESLLNDCNELRTTLAEVEKSRLEIKSRLNSSQFTCVSLENKFKMKETELEDLTIKINSLVEEKKLLQDSLDSASKSLTQMKSLNERLHQQNISLQNKVSHVESVRLETDRKMSSTSSLYSDKDNELKRLKRECEQLRERNIKLENEKRRFERSYVNLEREHSTLKNSIRSNNSHEQRSPSPSTASRFPTDQSSRSLLSLTQLLSETNFLNSNISKKDVIFDETMNITRSLEALEQKNLELQQKVLGLQNLMDAASSESDLNTTKNSDDLSDFRLNDSFSKSNKLETISSESNDNETDQIDFINNNSGNISENVDEKLKIAQIKAQNLIKSYDKEVTKLAKPRSGSSRSSSRRSVSDKEMENGVLFESRSPTFNSTKNRVCSSGQRNSVTRNN